MQLSHGVALLQDPGSYLRAVLSFGHAMRPLGRDAASKQAFPHPLGGYARIRYPQMQTIVPYGVIQWIQANEAIFTQSRANPLPHAIITVLYFPETLLFVFLDP